MLKLKSNYGRKRITVYFLALQNMQEIFKSVYICQRLLQTTFSWTTM